MAAGVCEDQSGDAAEQPEAMGGMVGADDVARWGGLGRAVSRCGTAREMAGEDRGGEVWDRWCGMNRGKEVEVQGVQVRWHGRRVWIAGGDARMVRRVVRRESGEASG